MVCEVSGRLYGTVASELPAKDALVWADAAAFLAGRIQGSASDCPGRAADMTSAAAKAACTTLGQIEAACKLMSNREQVAQDITNPGPKGLKGGQLTQLI